MNTIQIVPKTTKPIVKYGMVKGRVIGYSKKDDIDGVIVKKPLNQAAGHRHKVSSLVFEPSRNDRTYIT